MKSKKEMLMLGVHQLEVYPSLVESNGHEKAIRSYSQSFLSFAGGTGMHPKNMIVTLLPDIVVARKRTLDAF